MRGMLTASQPERMNDVNEKIAVVIPCYKVSEHIVPLIHKIGPEVSIIYVVDDCCPEGSGKLVQSRCTDPRVQVIFHSNNQGVGGALITGYKRAIHDSCDVVVKLDGDGQMDPSLISRFTHPIIRGNCDYTKGNRFYNIEDLRKMPKLRLFGNSILSFVNKLSSGYWTVMDPTNGYTAIHCRVLRILPLDKIDKRYFFEPDMLFRLNTVRAVVTDIPMTAIYGDETSNLNIRTTALTFPGKYLKRFLKRLSYNYFLRDFNAASVELIAGTGLLSFGFVYGVWHWLEASRTSTPASTGVVMLAALPVILGFQLLLAALSHDVSAVPQKPLHPSIF